MGRKTHENRYKPILEVLEPRLLLSGATVSIETVLVGDAGNTADDTGYGAVGYECNIGKHEVTNAQYAVFLNAVAKTDTHGLYNTNMGSGGAGGIACSSSEDGYSYTVRPDRGDRPVNYVSWYDALRFANWMHNGQPTGEQNDDTTEDGAYDMSLGNSAFRQPGATWALPTEDEWYKAAYYKGGATDAGYWDYPTQSSIAPESEAPVGASPYGSANYRKNGYVDATYLTTVVGAYETSDSPYGTFDQGGNVWEWNEAEVAPGRRGMRGGSFRSQTPDNLRASGRHYNYNTPGDQRDNHGFRVVQISTIPNGTTYEVNSLGDEVNPDDGSVTLRKAIAEANTLPGSDTIRFNQQALEAEALASNPAWTLDDGLIITLEGTQLEITDDLEIQGLGQDVLIIDADESSRVMSVSGVDTELTLSGMTLKRGFVTGHGGGIYNLGTLTLTNMTLSGNTATGDGIYSDGGAVYNEGSATLTNTILSGNSATGSRSDGGAIYNASGTLTLANSTVFGNSVTGGDSDGGGICNDIGGVFGIVNTTVSDNSSRRRGGGIYKCVGTNTLTNSTFLRIGTYTVLMLIGEIFQNKMLLSVLISLLK